MKHTAIVQARMGSTRLPGKVLKPILGRPMLALLLERMQRCPALDQIVVATSNLPQDDPVDQAAASAGAKVFRGSEADVLARYQGAAEAYGAKGSILRVTADNPFFHAPTATALFELLEAGCDYASNNLKRTFPYGIDLEAFTAAALAEAAAEATLPYDREHVTPFIKKQPGRFHLCNHSWVEDLSHLRLTVDTPEDFERAKALFEAFGDRVEFDQIGRGERG